MCPIYVRYAIYYNNVKMFTKILNHIYKIHIPEIKKFLLVSR